MKYIILILLALLLSCSGPQTRYEAALNSAETTCETDIECYAMHGHEM